MFSQKAFLEDKIKGLAKLIPSLNIIKNEAQDLVNTVNDISNSSEKISGKIRSLDVARVSYNNRILRNCADSSLKFSLINILQCINCYQ